MATSTPAKRERDSNTVVVDSPEFHCCQTRPPKRQRLSPCHQRITSPLVITSHDVADLNEKGIWNFKLGKMDIARDCFVKALDKLSRQIDGAQQVTTVETNLIPQDDFPVPETAGNDDSNTSNHDVEFGCVKIGATYDEGMYVFQEPRDLSLLLDKDQGAELSENSIRAVLSFNLGQVYICCEQFVEAYKQFEMALKEHRSNELHLSSAFECTLQVYHSLGYCSYRRGNFQDAKMYFSMALKEIRESSNNSKWELYEAATSNCIGVVLMYCSKAGRGTSGNAQLLEAALEHFAASLQIYRKLQRRRDEPQLLMSTWHASKTIATVLNNYGRVCCLQKKHAQALEAYQEALQIRQHLLESSSTTPNDVFATLSNIGQNYQALNDRDNAMIHFKKAWDIIQQYGCGTENCGIECLFNQNDVLYILKSIADIHHTRKETDKAMGMYGLAVAMCRRICSTATTKCLSLSTLLNRLGTVWYERGCTEEAMQCFQESLAMEKAILGPHHPRSITNMINIGHIHRLHRDYQGAYLQYKRARTGQIALFGESHIDVAQTLLHMGLMRYHSKMYDAAFRLYQEALRIQRDHYGCDENMEIATTLNSIGLVLFQRGDNGGMDASTNSWYKRLAKTVFLESLRIRTALLGRDHIEVGVVCYNLATLCGDLGDDDTAIRMYRENIRIEKNRQQQKQELKRNEKRVVDGPDGARVGSNQVPDNYSEGLVISLQQLGLVHQQRGELDKALACFREALDMERQVRSDPNNIDDATNRLLVVAKLLNLIGNLQLQQANVGDMMESFTEASRLIRTYNRQRSQHPQDNGRTPASLMIAGYNFYSLSRLNPLCAAVA